MAEWRGHPESPVLSRLFIFTENNTKKFKKGRVFNELLGFLPRSRKSSVSELLRNRGVKKTILVPISKNFRCAAENRGKNFSFWTFEKILLQKWG